MLLNAVWIGSLTVIIYLNSIKAGVKNGDELFAINLTIFKIHDTVLMNLAFGVIFTGLLFSLFTKWGFFQFHWVTVKWLSLLMLFVLITFFMAPAINGMAAISDVERLLALNNPIYQHYEKSSTLFSLTQLATLAIVVVISVFKPWGQRKKPFQVKRKVVLIVGGLAGILTLFSGVGQYWQLQSLRNLPIEQIELHRVPDGTYTGEADYGFNYQVEVTIKNKAIHNIAIKNNRASGYAKLAEGVVQKVQKSQSLNVDAVTGATTTGKCLLKAVENAIKKGLMSS